MKSMKKKRRLVCEAVSRETRERIAEEELRKGRSLSSEEKKEIGDQVLREYGL